MSDDLKNLNKNMLAMVRAQKLNALRAGQQTAISLGAKQADIKGDRYLDVTFSKRDSTGGVIDLKEAFSRGSSARPKKDGGWYTIVPLSYKTSNMSNSLYQEAKEMSSTESTTSYIDYLYGGNSLSDDSLSEFGITTQTHGGNLTRTPQGAVRGTYYAFRTVSDKSPADSWLLLIDRARAQSEDNGKLKKIGDSIQRTLISYN